LLEAELDLLPHILYAVECGFVREIPNKIDAQCMSSLAGILGFVD